MFKKWIIVWGILVLTVSMTLQAQVFTLDLPNYTLNPGFNNQVGFNFNTQSGNTLSSDISWSFRTDYLMSDGRATLELNYENSSQSGTVFNDNGLAAFRYIRQMSSAFEWEGVISHQYDTTQQVDNRFDIGGGMRFNLFGGTQDSQVSSNMTYGLGLLSETQSLSTDDSQSQSLRLVNYVSCLWVINPMITSNTTLRSLLNVGNMADHRADFVGSLAFQLTSQLSFTLQLSLNYNSSPAPGVQSLDTQYTNGLTWSF